MYNIFLLLLNLQRSSLHIFLVIAIFIGVNSAYCCVIIVFFCLINQFFISSHFFIATQFASAFNLYIFYFVSNTFICTIVIFGVKFKVVDSFKIIAIVVIFQFSPKVLNSVYIVHHITDVSISIIYKLHFQIQDPMLSGKWYFSD